ncbi:MAG: UvrD-helicase domain-containing protein [bacterium]|nr:UvrD-helicase domain-containing protein [bacterium]
MNDVPLSEKQTYGEKLVENLLQQITRQQHTQYFFKREPQLFDERGRSWEPDFVVVCAQYGVIVAEVKDWINIVSADQDKTIIIRKDGVQEEKENPVRTAKHYAHLLADKFETRAELKHRRQQKITLKFPWQPIVILPNIHNRIIEKLERSGIWPRGVVLGKESLIDAATFEKCLISLPWRFRLEQSLSNSVLNTIRGVLDPSIIVTDQEGIDRGELTLTQESLTKESFRVPQKQTLSLLGDDFMSEDAEAAVNNVSVRLVRGVAGSGKSLVLVRRALYLAEQYPNARICVLTFNKDLAADLRSRISNNQIVVTNFHKLCADAIGKQWSSPNKLEDWLQTHAVEDIHKLGLSVDFVAEEMRWRKDVGLFEAEAYLNSQRRGRGKGLTAAKRESINQIFDKYRLYQTKTSTTKPMAYADWDDVPYIATETLTKPHHHMTGLYDAILIDEAQDFAPSWIKVVKLLLKPDGLLFICDDPTQSLFRYFSWSEKGVSVVGRTRVLRTPFRCTREITQAAYSLVDADTILKSAEDATQPNLDSLELTSGSKPCLKKVHDAENEVAFIDRIVSQYLSAGIPGGQIAILCHSKRIVKHWAYLRNKGCYVETFEKMKGLEFRAVFVPHLHTLVETHATISGDEEIAATRRRIFTAMTRAREYLNLSYQNQLPQILEPLLPFVEPG